jgi:hypothetical protein
MREMGPPELLSFGNPIFYDELFSLLEELR